MAYSPFTDAAASLRRYKLTGINLNSAATDVGTFASLPAKYRVMRLMAYDPSGTMTLVTVDLRTATAGGGTALIAAAPMSGLSGSTKFLDAPLAVAADYQTASTLTLRNVVGAGSAATASFLLEIMDLT